jgi:hypothetical protein
MVHCNLFHFLYFHWTYINLSGSRSKSLKAAGEPRAPLVFCARHVLAVSAQCSLQSFPAPPLRFLHFSWGGIIKSQKMFCFYVEKSVSAQKSLRSRKHGPATFDADTKNLIQQKIQSGWKPRRGISVAGSVFYGSRLFWEVRCNEKKVKKIKKKLKKMTWALDTFWWEVYILIHRRNTELRLSKRNQKVLWQIREGNNWLNNFLVFLP